MERRNCVTILTWPTIRSITALIQRNHTLDNTTGHLSEYKRP